MTTIGERGVVLRVVEAAYRLESSESMWLHDLATECLPLLDRGLGVYAHVFEVDGDDVRYGHAAHIGPPIQMEVFRAAAARVPSSAYRGVATTLSTVAGAGACRRLAISSGLSTVGVFDALRASVTDPAGFGVAIGAPLPSIAVLTRQERLTLERLAAHVHTALRARRRRGLADDAVLSASGRLLHAEGEAKSSASREALREAAVAIDRARGGLRRTDPDAALEAWRAMVKGRWTLVDRFESDGRRFLVARPNTPGATPRGGLTRMETTCALYAAMGHSGKLIAYELGIAESTVSTHLQSALRKLGLRSRTALAGALGHPA
jgi:DNA-binding CsgD family transcriptional regulator